MAADKKPSGAQRMFGDFAPALTEFTDDALFGQVWARPELSPRERSLVTVASLVTSLVTSGSTEQLGYHLEPGQGERRGRAGAHRGDPHLAFYAGGRRPCPR